MIFGRLIGGLVGLIVMGAPGLLLGFLLGHFFDRGLARQSSSNAQEAESVFLEAFFLFSGYVAGADGRVSQEEINFIETFMHRNGIHGQNRDLAIELFRRGAAPGFNPQPVASHIQSLGQHRYRQLQRQLLEILVHQSLVDGQVSPGEYSAISNIAGALGCPQEEFATLVRMIQAQRRVYGQERQVRQVDQLDAAYQALGVAKDCDDKAVKLAYRRLMSKHHPDKMIAGKALESVVKAATEKTQSIQTAYDLIRKERGLR